MTLRIVAAILAFFYSSTVFGQALQFTAAGVPIAYKEIGSGPPVLLIHGFAVTGETNWSMGGVSEKLAENHRVVLMDVRGHGRSGKPRAANQYGVQMVHDVIGLLDHLHIGQAHIVGYSMGGLISMKLATEFPQRVASVCVGGAAWLRPDQEEAAEFIDQVASSLESGNGPLPLLQRLNPNPNPETLSRIQITNTLLKSINDTRALACVFRSLPELAISPASIRSCPTPALFLIGSNDPAPTSVDQLRSIMPPQFKVVQLAGADHLTTMTHPEFYDQIHQFIQAHPIKLPNNSTQP